MIINYVEKQTLRVYQQIPNPITKIDKKMKNTWNRNKNFSKFKYNHKKLW